VGGILVELILVFLGVGLPLERSRAAVSGHKRIHLDVTAASVETKKGKDGLNLQMSVRSVESLAGGDTEQWTTKMELRFGDSGWVDG
jgi:hypothetical protein